MPEILRLLIGTVLLRPYVFIFLAVYLVLAITGMGWRRTLLYTVLAYIVAFLCEYSSIHNGFPFGLYYYIASTDNQELWIAGVPFMDSLSFTFLSFISFELAIFLRSPLLVRSKDLQIVTLDRVRNSWFTSVLASILMMYLDIVIDPVALQGSRWFLGKIYYYPNGGDYFGVTIANFLGWLFVCFAILRCYLFLERLLARWLGNMTFRYIPFRGLGGPGLYFGVLGFNLSMTFLIGERTMGWASTFIIFLLLLQCIQHISWSSALEKVENYLEHKKNFPLSPLPQRYPELFRKK